MREMDAPPLFISGPKCCSIDTKEYADALTAARYPCGQATLSSAQRKADGASSGVASCGAAGTAESRQFLLLQCSKVFMRLAS